jgi:hypothetical protein
MSNENELNQDDLPEGQEGSENLPTRKQMLMQKARIMGISFSNNISEEALAEKINAKLNNETPPKEGTTSDLNPLAGDKAGAVPAAKKTLRQRIVDEEMALVRVRVTNMDPKKKDLRGEIMTVANDYLGTVRKFVPFGEDTDEGYHIPKCILTMMQERRFLQIREVRDRKTGIVRPETAWVREFGIEILPPLTEQELKQLATAQIAAGTVGTNSD